MKVEKISLDRFPEIKEALEKLDDINNLEKGVFKMYRKGNLIMITMCQKIIMCKKFTSRKYLIQTEIDPLIITDTYIERIIDGPDSCYGMDKSTIIIENDFPQNKIDSLIKLYIKKFNN